MEISWPIIGTAAVVLMGGWLALRGQRSLKQDQSMSNRLFWLGPIGALIWELFNKDKVETQGGAVSVGSSVSSEPNAHQKMNAYILGIGLAFLLVAWMVMSAGTGLIIFSPIALAGVIVSIVIGRATASLYPRTANSLSLIITITPYILALLILAF